MALDDLLRNREPDAAAVIASTLGVTGAATISRFNYDELDEVPARPAAWHKA
jgi:hypothetical protein